MPKSKGALYIGTSSWSSKDWIGRFYDPGTKPADFIAQYAEKFNTVEVDSTFYGVPRPTTVEGWKKNTPSGFKFAAKFPQTVTHEKFLENCDADCDAFLNTMSGLEDRLGPLLLQFPYFAKKRGVTEADFVEKLEPFLQRLPQNDFQFAVEVRNKTWINDRLTDLLEKHNAALALIDHPWMHPPDKLKALPKIVTSSFLYVRWLGDRLGIEKLTKTWNENVVDRKKDLENWAPLLNNVLERGVPVYGYVNNHYSGYAPSDAETIRSLLGG